MTQVLMLALTPQGALAVNANPNFPPAQILQWLLAVTEDVRVQIVRLKADQKVQLVPAGAVPGLKLG